MDEKWKPSKKELCNGNSNSKYGFTRSCSTRSSSSKSPLLRSFSQKSSPNSSKSALPRSFSHNHHHPHHQNHHHYNNNSDNNNINNSNNNHSKSSSIGRKCTSLAKEHKARFYIMRRCVAMLVCWHKHGDS